jgi:hypothetical protein
LTQQSLAKPNETNHMSLEVLQEGANSKIGQRTF